MAETKEAAPKAAETNDNTAELIKALTARVEAAEARADAAEKTSKVAPAAASDAPAKPKRLTKTKVGSHRATRRGYVHGEIIEEGKPVPADTVISDEWMEETEGSGRRARAVAEAHQDHPTDVDLTKLEKAALQAMAAERGVNVGGLSREDLIAAIRAEREPTI